MKYPVNQRQTFKGIQLLLMIRGGRQKFPSDSVLLSQNPHVWSSLFSYSQNMTQFELNVIKKIHNLSPGGFQNPKILPMANSCSNPNSWDGKVLAFPGYSSYFFALYAHQGEDKASMRDQIGLSIYVFHGYKGLWGVRYAILLSWPHKAARRTAELDKFFFFPPVTVCS